MYDDFLAENEYEDEEEQSGFCWQDYDPDVSTHDATTCDCTHCEASRDVEGEEEPMREAAASFNVYSELVPVLRRHLTGDKDFSCAKESTKLWDPSKPKFPVLLDPRWNSLKDFHWQEIRDNKDASKFLKSPLPHSRFFATVVSELDFSTTKKSAEAVLNPKPGAPVSSTWMKSVEVNNNSILKSLNQLSLISRALESMSQLESWSDPDFNDHCILIKYNKEFLQSSMFLASQQSVNALLATRERTLRKAPLSSSTKLECWESSHYPAHAFGLEATAAVRTHQEATPNVIKSSLEALLKTFKSKEPASKTRSSFRGATRGGR